MKFSINNSIKSSKENIKKIEEKYSIKLPISYLNFLFNIGGGEIIENIRLKIPHSTDYLFLRHMYTLTEFDNFFNFEFDHNSYITGIKTIGLTHAPLSICIGVYENEFYGQIFLYGWDLGLIKIANDLNNFFDLLELDENL